MARDPRPRMKTECSDADLEKIIELIANGCTYSVAAMLCNVRPSSLRFRKKVDPIAARRLLAAWEQGGRLHSGARQVHVTVTVQRA